MSLRIDSVDYIAEDAAYLLINPFTLELRTFARSQEWPAHIVNALSVGYEDGSLVIEYPDELEEEIGNLEYGDINSLPRPALRPFMFRAPASVRQVIERQSLGALFEELGVV